ncbi:MAG: NAD(P)H-dependent glycerol-3-phosphate dehydrogenase [Actinomycetota bacterium]|jgi:glycerol-3-phosphate dehydrogenase (NAD(P)+)|nr:NAD(P)H-dependent glycerol-3-phosphate dehydrogenase [Actinomycetota bacterium]
MRVAVIGAGSWGTTVAAVMSRNADVTLWARRPEVAAEIDEQHTNNAYLPGFELPEQLRATADLDAAASAADVVVMGVPSHGFRDIVSRAAPSIRPWVPVISLTKGFEAESLLRPTEVIAEVLPGHPVGVLTGPNLAREIMAGQAAAAVVATEDLQVARALQGLVQSGLFRVYVNHDVVGCEVGGALKNVIALAAGMAEGLGTGDNTRAMVITRGLAELTRLGVAMGAESQTLSGLAGMGDLLATCVSQHSRNRHVGEQLGLGRSLDEIIAEMNMVAEGVKTTASVLELGARHDVDLPICRTIHQVVYEGATPEDAYAGLLQRAAGHEYDSD